MKLKYCGKCGSKLLVKKIPATQVSEFYGTDRSFPYSEYDMKNGKKRFGRLVFCPKARWWTKGHAYWTEILRTR